MRILICDDDVMIQRELTKYLSEYFHRHNLRLPDICRFHTGHDLLLDSGNKDIVFFRCGNARVKRHFRWHLS